MFRNIKEVFWISLTALSSDRKDNITGCCTEQKVDFKYPNNVEDFNNLLEFCQRKKSSCNENYLRENMVLDRLIAMDSVSGLADISEEFANFLTVSRKFGLICVYIFQTIYPTRQHWQMILSQTKMVKFFQGSVQASFIIRTLSSFCNRYRHSYIPHRDLWMN